MAMYQIKSWLNGDVLFECDVPDANSGMAARFTLEKATEFGADLSRADLSRADLSRADLSGANLSGADLSRANLSGANLYGADLSGANLYGANLYSADLSGANLSGADLYSANLYGANLSRANLYSAKIDGEEITKPPVQIGGLDWSVVITDGFMRIGCQRHSHADWAGFDAIAIGNMSDGAVEFWGQWKSILLSMCASHAIDKN